MAASILAQRYAKAIFAAASHAKELKPASAGATNLLKALETAELQTYLSNRAMSGANKFLLLEQALGSSMKGSIRRSIQVVSENGRNAELGEIMRAFLDLVEDQDRRLKAGIRVASPLTAAQRKTLENSLGRQLKRKVELIPVVDASILGGAVLDMDDTIYDGSLKAALAKLKTALLVEPKAPKVKAIKSAVKTKKSASKKKAGVKKKTKKVVKKKAAPKKKVAPKKKTSKKKAR